MSDDWELDEQLGLAPSETLSLELLPIEQAVPHEHVDEKRVARLMGRLKKDSLLVNPPIAASWEERYVVLDGATRVTAMRRLGYPHIIVQVVDPEKEGLVLSTWNHVISHDQPALRSLDALLKRLGEIDTVGFEPIRSELVAEALEQPEALCSFTGRNNRAVVALANGQANRVSLMNALVTGYNDWGEVERTLLGDLPRLLGQFPRMTAVASFPQFALSQVFETAGRGELLPAGVTRFVIPGRILRLNAELARLKADQPLVAKRAWFDEFLAEKLAKSRVRYYQEPVILLDE